MSLSPGGSRALVANGSGGLIVYDISSARVIACASGIRDLDEGSPAMFVHGGHAILVGCKGGGAKLFDATSASCLQTLNHEGQFSAVQSDVSNLAVRRGGRPRVGSTYIHFKVLPTCSLLCRLTLPTTRTSS